MSLLAKHSVQNFPIFWFLLFLYIVGNPGKLQQFAALPLDAPLWVQIGQQDELAEAELKYIGPLTRGSSAVIFGVQLKVNSTLEYERKPSCMPRRSEGLHAHCVISAA